MPAPLRQIALKVDVDTYRGTCHGVPSLVRLFTRHAVGATFLFSLGPDHTGRAIRRIFRPGFFGKVQRTSVVSHYGLQTLLYGTLLPGPHIARRCRQILTSVRDAGFEVGIHTYDHVYWQDHVAARDEPWTRREMQSAFDTFQEVFGVAARTHGAAGWQMNQHAFHLTRELGFDYCSDTRGRCPFVPVANGQIIGCPQLPTTLPTLDELIGTGDITEQNVVHRLLARTEGAGPEGHVYTLHAELEGMKWAPIMDALVRGWKNQGYALLPLRDYFAGQSRLPLPRHEVVQAKIDGRSGTLAMQGPRSTVGIDDL